MNSNERERLKNLDRQFVWHPFTQMQEWLGMEPLVIEKGEGASLIDIDGKRYLDGVSSLWVTVHGHNHPHIQAALRRQIDLLDHSTLLGLANVPSIELAKRLIDIAPKGLSKVFYSDSGSTAVEIALKMAFQYWQQRKPDAKFKSPQDKKNFLVLDQSYHGDTIGSVSLGGIDLFHQLYKPLLFETRKAPSPRQDLDASKACALIKKHAHELAAFIVEPLMQGAAGMLKAPAGYLCKIRQACSEHGVFLIADEVATGFGRTGKMFACEHEGVTPDFLCLAKGITGGVLPLAATLTTQEVFDGFLGAAQDLRTFFHGHTYTGNPLACAAALASLDLFEAAGFWESLAEKIQSLELRLQPLAQNRWVGDIRQVGLMVGIEIMFGEQIGHRICRAARAHGVILRPLGNVIVLMPPLCITAIEINQILSAVEGAIGEVLG